MRDRVRMWEPIERSGVEEDFDEVNIREVMGCSEEKDGAELDEDWRLDDCSSARSSVGWKSMMRRGGEDGAIGGDTGWGRDWGIRARRERRCMRDVSGWVL